MDRNQKALAPFGNGTFLSFILSKLDGLFDSTVIVIKPGLERTFRASLTDTSFSHQSTRISFVTQPEPIGSLDAVCVGLPSTGENAVVLWCDQIGVSRDTVQQLIEALDTYDLALPYLEMTNPYVWLETAEGTITGIGRSRDGDKVPECGKADLGVFALSARAIALLQSQQSVLCERLSGRELDFTYALPLLSAGTDTLVFPTFDVRQSIAVNSPEDLVIAEKELLHAEN